MKTLTAIIACMLISISVYAQKQMTTRYRNGAIRETYTVNAQGVKHGAYKLYTIDGKLAETTTYQNGELVGKQTTYFDNGQVATEWVWKDGVTVSRTEYRALPAPYNKRVLRLKQTFSVDEPTEPLEAWQYNYRLDKTVQTIGFKGDKRFAYNTGNFGSDVKLSDDALEQVTSYVEWPKQYYTYKQWLRENPQDTAYVYYDTEMQHLKSKHFTYKGQQTAIVYAMDGSLKEDGIAKIEEELARQAALKAQVDAYTTALTADKRLVIAHIDSLLAIMQVATQPTSQPRNFIHSTRYMDGYWINVITDYDDKRYTKYMNIATNYAAPQTYDAFIQLIAYVDSKDKLIKKLDKIVSTAPIVSYNAQMHPVDSVWFEQIDNHAKVMTAGFTVHVNLQADSIYTTERTRTYDELLEYTMTLPDCKYKPINVEDVTAELIDALFARKSAKLLGQSAIDIKLSDGTAMHFVIGKLDSNTTPAIFIDDDTAALLGMPTSAKDIARQKSAAGVK